MKNLKLLSLFSVFALFILMAFTGMPPKRLIVIDAGHGGADEGASNGALTEKTIVENIGRQIKKLNKDANIEIVLLRADDQFISLPDRAAKINAMKPDLVISLHLNNSSNKEIKGIEAIVSEKNKFLEKSKYHALELLQNLQGDNFEMRGIIDRDLHILKNSDCPAVVLELGFLSNENDRAILSTEMGQLAIAEKILKGLKK